MKDNITITVTIIVITKATAKPKKPHVLKLVT